MKHLLTHFLFGSGYESGGRRIDPPSWPHLSLYSMMLSIYRSRRHSKNRSHSFSRVFIAVVLQALLLIPLTPDVSRADLIWYSAMDGTADPLVPDVGAITCAFSGTPTGGVTGKFGTAFDFDAATPDYLNCGTTLPLSTDNFSVGVWVKVETSGNYRTAMNIGVSNLSGVFLAVSNADKVYCVVVTGTNVANASTSTASVNETGSVWTHIGCIKNGTAIKTCLNGADDGSATAATATMDYTSAGNVFYIGARESAGLPFLGQIDEVRVYNSVETCAGLYAIDPTVSTTSPIIIQ